MIAGFESGRGRRRPLAGVHGELLKKLDATDGLERADGRSAELVDRSDGSQDRSCVNDEYLCATDALRSTRLPLALRERYCETGVDSRDCLNSSDLDWRR